MSVAPDHRPIPLMRVVLATVATLALWTLLIAALVWRHGSGWPQGQGPVRPAPPDQWMAALGDLGRAPDSATLTGLTADGEGLLIWRPPAFDAAHYPIVTLNLDHFPLNYVLMLAWKSPAASESTFTRLQVPLGRTQSYLMSRLPDWQGRIEELALYLYPQPQTSPPLVLAQPVVVRQFQLEPDTAGGRLAALATSWLAADPWEMMSPSSLGTYPDIDEGLRLTPLVFVLLVLALPVFALALKISEWRRALKLLGVGVLAGTVILQVHWMARLGTQTLATARLAQAFQSDGARLYDFDLLQLVAAARQQLPPAGAVRIFIASDARFFRLRAGWHLRPHNVFTFLPGQDIQTDPDQIKPGDYLLTYRRPDLVRAAGSGVVILANRVLPVQVLLRSGNGSLIRFEDREQ